jgi:glycosyltransferase involved in cell wall biosynthesis
MWPLTAIGLLAHQISGSRARVVVSDHIAFDPQYLGFVEAPLLRWSTRLLYPHADFRTIISARAADSLAEMSGLPRQSIEVLGNPISPPDDIAPSREAEASWYGRPRLLSIGSLKPQKNHALLLRAFARVKDKRSSLVILGEGSSRAELESLAAELGIDSRVSMPGFRVDPWPWLAAADLFVLSSNWEGLPLVLAEALHAGLPVVSTDCASGPAEMLDHGRYGQLVPCGDADALASAIEQALAKPRQSGRQRARALELAGPWTIERYLELLLGEEESPR